MGLIDKLTAAFRRTPRKNAIIVGTGLDEYQLMQRLHAAKEYQVRYFIDEQPWSHRTKLGNAELRYPSELPALCRNHDIVAVFYLDDTLVQSLSVDTRAVRLIRVDPIK